MNLIEIIRRPLVRRTLVGLSVAVVAAGLVIHDAGQRSGVGPTPGSDPAGPFLDRYVTPDGRVVRPDQGGDTVSEGQAYALLVAVAAGDEARFDTVWDWTRRNLQRSDGLLSWHWRGGGVVDPQPAADADVDAARALTRAADRFSRPDLRAEATRIARGVMDGEVVTAAGRTALAAGPWAVPSGTVNPGYFSPCGAIELARVTGDASWDALAGDAVALLDGLTAGGRRLPSDWAHLDGAGTLQATSAPGDGAGVRYGLDAARVAARLAERCTADGETGDRARRLAAALWPTLAHLPADGAGIAYHLDGTLAVSDDDRNPAGLVAAASAASAAGDGPASARLLGEAADLDRRAPSYYGAAWLALAGATRTGDAGAALPAARSAEEAVPVRLIAATAPAGGRPVTTTTAPGSTTTGPPPSTTTSPPTTTSTSPPTTSTTGQPATRTSGPPTTTTAPTTTSTGPTTSTTAGSTTTTGRPTTTTGRPVTTTGRPATTASTGATGGSPPPTTTNNAPPASGPGLPTTSGQAPARAVPRPRPLQPGVLTGPATPEPAPPPPATPGAAGAPDPTPAPASPAVPADRSAPARTGVLVAGAGLTVLLGTRLGRRAI